MFAVRMTLRMIETGTEAYAGMTTGRGVPGFTKDRWLPSCLSNCHPSRMKIFSKTVQWTGTILGTWPTA